MACNIELHDLVHLDGEFRIALTRACLANAAALLQRSTEAGHQLIASFLSTTAKCRRLGKNSSAAPRGSGLSIYSEKWAPSCVQTACQPFALDAGDTHTDLGY